MQSVRGTAWLLKGLIWIALLRRIAALLVGLLASDCAGRTLPISLRTLQGLGLSLRPLSEVSGTTKTSPIQENPRASKINAAPTEIDVKPASRLGNGCTADRNDAARLPDGKFDAAPALHRKIRCIACRIEEVPAPSTTVKRIFNASSLGVKISPHRSEEPRLRA
ncbi:hypothetical protein NDU88_001490 [Pleurodeles waltl]|uniref:Uncharacterized protein n=1 Tax=Pleurodeles waltl TaxID=8319 RepID=A0AAV7S7R8_PLEWA|nr:hypothetical protein NDU88_001490 [Pleurodeles waltl]